MKKKIDFYSARDSRLDETIRTTMQREFEVPDQVKKARDEAFEKISARMKKQAVSEAEAKKAARRKKRKIAVKAAGSAAAAAAVFSVVCISNPALAENIPLIGHVFGRVGNLLGFSGDYETYAEPLTETDETQANKNAETSRTADGVTVTLSEIYCNDTALNIAMVIESEEPFPKTMTDQEGKLVTYLRAGLCFSYNPQVFHGDSSLDGVLLDDHTFAGVYRVPLEETASSQDEEAYYEALEAFFETYGISAEEREEDPSAADRKLLAALGSQEEYLTNTIIAKAGGPAWEDYMEFYKVPDTFTVDMDITQILGDLAESTAPAMPQDLIDEYHAAMAEYGLSTREDDYASFTDEEKEIENKLYNQQYQKYLERYPEAGGFPNPYENWWFDGPWDFTFTVTKSDADTIVKEIHDTDENGWGIETVTRTPFEITYSVAAPKEAANDCFVEVLDADGNILSWGRNGRDGVRAIGDSDVSTVDFYFCDYDEYMEELKGYYWSDDYETKKKTKTYKELLEEHAMHHTQVSFEE